MPITIQTATAGDLNASGAIDLSDFMNRKLSGVYVNNNQENPFQPDLNYRGYTASPLLGTPEGLSVYLDGVRQNPPVRWRDWCTGRPEQSLTSPALSALRIWRSTV